MLLTEQGQLDPGRHPGRTPAGRLAPPGQTPLDHGSLLAHRAGLPAWRPFYRELCRPRPRPGGPCSRAWPRPHPWSTPRTPSPYIATWASCSCRRWWRASPARPGPLLPGKILPSPGTENLGLHPLAQTSHRKPKTENRKPPLRRHRNGPDPRTEVGRRGPRRKRLGRGGRGRARRALRRGIRGLRLWPPSTGLTGVRAGCPSPRPRCAVSYPRPPGPGAGGSTSPAPSPPLLGRALLFARQRRPPGLYRHLFLAGPGAGQMVVLLTNRVHLGRDDKAKIQAFRPRFHEAASRALGF